MMMMMMMMMVIMRSSVFSVRQLLLGEFSESLIKDFFNEGSKQKHFYVSVNIWRAYLSKLQQCHSVQVVAGLFLYQSCH